MAHVCWRNAVTSAVTLARRQSQGAAATFSHFNNLRALCRWSAASVTSTYLIPSLLTSASPTSCADFESGFDLSLSHLPRRSSPLGVFSWTLFAADIAPAASSALAEPRDDLHCAAFQASPEDHLRGIRVLVGSTQLARYGEGSRTSPAISASLPFSEASNRSSRGSPSEATSNENHLRSRSSTSDTNMTAPVPFSYAQAAKGLSTAPTKQSPSAPPSKDAAIDPATTSPAMAIASAPSWADDAEKEETRGSKQTNGTVDTAPKTIEHQDATSTAPSLPDSAASTTKDDDSVSVQNAPSESASTWESKSQASTAAEKTPETSSKRSEKGKGKKKSEKSEKSDKPQLEYNYKPAPVPTVNAWAQRIQERTASAQKVAPLKQTAAVNGATLGVSEPAKKVEEKGAETTKETKTQDEKSSASRKETKLEADADKPRKGLRSKIPEKDHKNSVTATPLPPDRDQESWPTPETAVDEQRKKSQSKGDRVEVERKDASDRPRGRQEWKSMDIIPNVIFSTPLPGSSTTRKGGRNGGRGGISGTGRHGGLGANGGASSDKEAGVTPSGEHARRTRSEGTATFEGSAPAAGTTVTDETKLSGLPVESTKTNGEVEAEGAQKNGAGSPVNINGHSHTYPRHHPQGRGNKPRRGEYNGTHTDRRNSDKDSHGTNGRRVSTAVQGDSSDDTEKRNASSHEGQNGHPSKGSHERRQFGSFSGRERGGRGGRGGRGAFQSNHGQFTNGNSPSMQGSSTFSVRSPTAFNPDQGFFPNAALHARSFRNGHRSQSVTTESMYGRPAAYHSQMPMQNFVPEGFEYQHPVAAMPFADPSQVIPMLLHQM